MESAADEGDLERLTVRRYRPEDRSAVESLYQDGLLAGQIDPNDTGADIENIEEAYLSDAYNGFWVAEVDAVVRGMVGVAQDDAHKAQIRRLRVEKAWQNTAIAARLIETALSHCKRHGYLKVVLDTRFEHEQAVDLFDRFGFQHNRTKNIGGKDLIEFYLDLYRRSRPDESE